MKKISTILTILFLSLLTACDKWPNDRPLDGMWQLQSENHNGTVTQRLDDQRYWSLRREIAQFSSHADPSRRYAHYQHKGNSLRFYNFVMGSKNESAADNNEWISLEKAENITPWGIRPQADAAHPGRICATYRILKLQGDRLILANETDTLSFRRF